MNNKAISAMGEQLGPEVLAKCEALYDAEQRALVTRISALATDLPYGPHERQQLDIYAPAGTEPLPILVFVHGGGFLKGDKGSMERWPNANVGRMAADLGFLGVVINYRLAPENTWPSGAGDVATTVDWLRANAPAYNGNPDKIVLMGTSAGAVHVAGYLKLRPSAMQDICGAILLSGLYGCTSLDDRDTLYYGDAALYTERRPLEAIASTTMPLLIACAEFDPPRFQAEFLGLLQDRLERHGVMPRSYIASGHNHYSMTMHLGTSDARLADEISNFVKEVAKA